MKQYNGKNRSNKGATLEERFWFYVNKLSDNECWEWIGNRRGGYGRLYYDGKLLSSHRASWMIHFGNIDQDLKVLHHCDNPSCVNPKHLFLGTQCDNVLDMCNKGRQVAPKGDKQHLAKLSEKDAKKIRELYETKAYSYVTLATMFSVSKGCINHVINGRSWAWAK